MNIRNKMSEAQLTYFPGSPFARMARVLVIEWDLPVQPVECEFPPSDELFAENPLGQVPALIFPDRSVFPTLLVLEKLWDMAGQPPAAYAPDFDRQTLMTILQMTDAMVAAFYQGWTGLEPIGENLIGYDPAERNLKRTQFGLDWLDERSTASTLRAGLNLPAVALACLVLWADSRGKLNWRDRHSLARLVDGLAAHDSFVATVPPDWR
ncbi:MAG: glutathione S-transferase family protein [Paracoccaceae bacterium]